MAATTESGVASPHANPPHQGRRLMPSVEELLQEARRLDLSHAEGRFRLGDLAEELCRALPAVADVLDRLAIDLEVDRDALTEAWWVAAAFPPATRCPGLPWASYLLLRFHPQRHELAKLAAREDWDQAHLQQELAARFPAHHHTHPGQ
jgi:hypothetical protein